MEEDSSGNDEITQLVSPFRDKITINLPIDELNTSRFNALVSIEDVRKKTKSLEDSLVITKEKVNNIANNVDTINAKSLELTQAAQVVLQKFVALNEWVDTADKTETSFIMQMIIWFIWLFSLLEWLLVSVWGGMRITTKIKKEQKVINGQRSDLSIASVA